MLSILISLCNLHFFLITKSVYKMKYTNIPRNYALQLSKVSIVINQTALSIAGIDLNL